MSEEFYSSGDAKFCPPDKSAHISAHNAVRFADEVRSATDRARRARHEQKVEESYQKAKKRAEKRGRELPPRDDYYNHWGYTYASKRHSPRPCPQDIYANKVALSVRPVDVSCWLLRWNVLRLRPVYGRRRRCLRFWDLRRRRRCGRSVWWPWRMFCCGWSEYPERIPFQNGRLPREVMGFALMSLMLTTRTGLQRWWMC